MIEHHLLLNEHLCFGVCVVLVLVAAMAVFVGCSLSSETRGAVKAEICSQLSSCVLEDCAMNSIQNKVFILSWRRPHQVGQRLETLNSAPLCLLLPLEDVAAEHKALKKAFCSDSLCLGLKYEVLRWCHLLGLGEKFWYQSCAFEQRLV